MPGSTACTCRRARRSCRPTRPSSSRAGWIWKPSPTASTAEETEMAPERAREEVAKLTDNGMAVELVELGGQWYAHTNGGPVPSPPWNKSSFDILIAIPAAYDAADLDAFYVELPCRFGDGEH